MDSVLIEFEASCSDDLKHPHDILQACSGELKNKYLTENVKNIYFKILPSTDWKNTLGEVENLSDTLLECYASILGDSIDTFPDQILDPIVSVSPITFSPDAKPSTIKTSHGNISFGFCTKGNKNGSDRVFPIKQYQKVCMGGTFDRLHQGHKLMLLRAALSTTGTAVIGVANGDLLKNKKFKELLETFDHRKSAVEKFCHNQREDITWYVFSLGDAYGPAITDPSIEGIVVSPETATGASSINQRRHEAGMAPLDVLSIPYIKAPPSLQKYGDGKETKISSTMLRSRDKERAEQHEHKN